MKNIFGHMRVYVLRGILAVIPIILSYFALRFIYIFIDQRVIRMFDRFIGVKIPGLGLLILLVLLYFVGVIASNVLGKQLFNLVERIARRIPLVNTTYHIGKQLALSLSLPEKQLFKKVVLGEMRPGVWMIGFVTGSLKDAHTGEELLKVFLPTVPNPTTGFVIVMKASQTRDSKWSVDEALRLVISGGIIGPDDVG